VNEKEEQNSPEMSAHKQDTPKILPQEKIKDTAEFSGDEQSADYADFADFKDLRLEKKHANASPLKGQVSSKE
jgi:hypothetical protein